MSECIDVHHHFYAPEYIAMREGSGGGLPGFAKNWTPQESLADMDGSDVRMALLSAGADAALPPQTARAVNEYAAGLVRTYSGRFGLFAALPIPDVDASLQEIAYALDVLGAQGVGMLTSYGKTYLGDPAYWPIFEELHRRHAIVFIHPTLNECCAGIVPDLGPTVIEFGTDTTRAIASLVFGGAASKYHNIRFIFSHGGGTMPFLIGRFVNHARTPHVAERLPNGLLPELQRFYYETAQVSNRGAMASLRELVPTSQVLFGTDFPYRRAKEQIAGLATSGFSNDELGAIAGPNALRLLG